MFHGLYKVSMCKEAPLDTNPGFSIVYNSSKMYIYMHNNITIHLLVLRKEGVQRGGWEFKGTQRVERV